jgi:hypothetical protein
VLYSPDFNRAAKIAEIESIGSALSDYGHEQLMEMGLVDFEVWPDNWLSYQVFSCIGTQWRTGMNGATGLDYNVLPEIWRRLKVPFKERDNIFQDIRIMESTALETMRENKG